MSDPMRDGLWMLAAGAGVPVLAGLNAALGQRIGSPLAAAVVLFGVAVVVTAMALILSGGTGVLRTVLAQPKALFLGGVLIAFYVVSITTVAPRFGLGNAVLFVLLGQIVSSAVIDQFGLTGLAARPVSATRLLGLGLMAAGVILSQKGQGWT